MISELESTLRALAQSTRLKIIKLLVERDLCVCELEEILQITQPAVSQHLRVLKNAGLVRENRSGQWVFYSLDLDAVRQVLSVFGDFLHRPAEDLNELAEETTRLKHLEENPRVVFCKNRGNTC